LDDPQTLVNKHAAIAVVQKADSNAHLLLRKAACPRRQKVLPILLQVKAQGVQKPLKENPISQAPAVRRPPLPNLLVQKRPTRAAVFARQLAK
jgi:hypothetical protein